MPVQIAPLLTGHEVESTRGRGWDLLSNGRLLKAAESEGFRVMITGDKSIVKQQNNSKRVIALVLVGNPTLEVLIAHVPAVFEAVQRSAGNSFEAVPMPGNRDFKRR